jgi:hypothetical protein
MRTRAIPVLVILLSTIASSPALSQSVIVRPHPRVIVNEARIHRQVERALRQTMRHRERLRARIRVRVNHRINFRLHHVKIRSNNHWKLHREGFARPEIEINQ